MKFGSTVFLLSALFTPKVAAFQSNIARNAGNPKSSVCSATAMPDLTFTSPDMTGIEEQACIDAAQRMSRVAVPVPSEISSSGSVGISYINWPAQGQKKKAPPVLLIHGFDSSGLEYRRLGPKLAEKGFDAYAVDILGWGYTQHEGVSSFSADAKVTALQSFVETMFGKSAKFCIAGASLGGAAAIELAAAKKEDCAGLILIDAQGFVDGIGPMAMLPTPLAKLGVGVLRSVPLRNSANQMSYFDKDTFATEEAQVIGRIHTLREGWTDAMVSFMQSGGFSPSAKVPTIDSPALILWGRQDGILDGSEYATKFVETLPNARLQWIEECGHVPHLEQPDATADAIENFVASDVSTNNAAATSSEQEGQQSPPYIVGAGFIGALAISQILSLLSQQ